MESAGARNFRGRACQRGQVAVNDMEKLMKFHFWRTCASVVAAAAFVAAAYADEGTAAKADQGTAATADEGSNANKVEEKLRSIAPTASTIAISDSPIPGLLQAQINNEIVYVSADGAYLLQGTMYDLDTRTNLTEQARSVVRKDLLTNIDISQMISFAPEHPKYEVFVFTDIDCAYCRKLHSQINDYMNEGIAIRYMAYPRAGIGSHSYDKWVSVWCADDQQTALTQAKLGNEPEPLQCDNPVADQFELGRKLGVSGTPALVTRDGTMIPGYMPPEALAQRLESIKANLAQAP